MHVAEDNDLFMNACVFHDVWAASVSLMLTEESQRGQANNSNWPEVASNRNFHTF